MKDRKLAVRYAGALLSVLDDPDRAAAADEFLTAVARAMDESAEFRGLMMDPAVPRKARKSVLRSIAEQKGQPPQVANFLSALVDNNRLRAFPSIAAVFHELSEEARGVLPAEVTTAMPLSDELAERMRSTLGRVTGRKIRLTCRVDPALIGGAVTRIGSKVYDGTLRTQLGQLRRRMDQE